MLLNKGAIVIDVRTPLEFLAANFPGSINVPVDDFALKIEQIVNKKSIIITCCSTDTEESTSRSKMSSTYLRQLGYKKVYTAGNWQNLLT